eukprot:2068619-Lingulodinium_polyedra.AAC.1
MDLELQKLAAAGMKPNEAKHAFRQEWAKETFKERFQGEAFEKQRAKVDTEKGKYVCFAKLVEEMGFNFDPAGALARAEQHATRC